MPEVILSDYFYGDESEEFIYFKIPRLLITDQKFKHVSTDTKLLYGMLLDRMGLSAKNDWYDDSGRVYICYTVDEICEDMCCGRDKAMAVYRVERTRDYTVMSNYHLKNTSLSLKAKGLLSMFLSFPDDWNYNTRGLAAICKEGVDAIGSTIKELEKTGYIVRRKLRGSNGRITDTEYVIYEHPQEPPAPDADVLDMPQPDTAQPDTENPDMVDPDAVGPDMDAPHTENPAQLNKYQSITQKSNTQRPNIHSFPPSTPSPQPPARPVEGMKKIFEKRADIQAQIDYELIVTPSNQAQIDEFVEIMLEVALTRTPTMKIGRDAEYPTAFVQQRFDQLTSIHIETA